MKFSSFALFVNFAVSTVRQIHGECTYTCPDFFCNDGGTINGNTIQCLFDGENSECEFGTIEGCDTVDCIGKGACAETIIIGAKDVNCDGTDACYRADIQQMQDEGNVNCGENACRDAKIGINGKASGKFNALCKGQFSCSVDASIKTSGTVICKTTDGFPACGNTNIESECLVCDGESSCDSELPGQTCEYTPFGGSTSLPCPNNDNIGDCAEQFCLSRELTTCELFDFLEKEISESESNVEMAISTSENNLHTKVDRIIANQNMIELKLDNLIEFVTATVAPSAAPTKKDSKRRLKQTDENYVKTEEDDDLE
jgi:hypothetical protein